MTTVRLLKNGVEAFPAMHAAIDGASSSISLEMYIFADDETGREFRRHLVAAAGRGVKVRLLIDAWGSWNLPDSFWDDLRSAGGTVRWFHPLLQGLLPFRNHRKLLLIDSRLAYVGGMNIADAYYRGERGALPWRDNALEIEGSEAAVLRRSFLRMWYKASSPLRRKVLRLRRSRRIIDAAGGSVRFLESGPENPMLPVRRAYRTIVKRAARNIDLAMGYFYPNGGMLRALKRAVRRGVRVRLMVPLHTDVPASRWAAWGLYGRVLRAGVEVWEYAATMMHSKLAIADDTLIAGSANLDIRSGRINYELVAMVTDGGLAAQARADFEEDLKQSVPITLSAWQKRPFLQKVKEWISYCLLARFDVFLARREIRKI